mgnify:CR=1 FL=1
MRYITKSQIPKDRRKDITYASFTCDYRPNKAEMHRNENNELCLNEEYLRELCEENQ